MSLLKDIDINTQIKLKIQSIDAGIAVYNPYRSFILRVKE